MEKLENALNFQCVVPPDLSQGTYRVQFKITFDRQ